MRNLILLAAFVGVLGTVGCGSSDPAPPASYSCYVAPDAECRDIAAATGSTFSGTDVTTFQTWCQSTFGTQPGVWSTAACPTTTPVRVGTCTFADSWSNISVPFQQQARFYVPHTVLEGQNFCAAVSGVWTAN